MRGRRPPPGGGVGSIRLAPVEGVWGKGVGWGGRHLGVGCAGEKNKPFFELMGGGVGG